MYVHLQVNLFVGDQHHNLLWICLRRKIYGSGKSFQGNYLVAWFGRGIGTQTRSYSKLLNVASFKILNPILQEKF